jgi:ATP:ADP antiporter, AAA family
MQASAHNSATPAPRAILFGRSLALFANFFLIILAYYQVKAASRSLLIEFGGADALPYAWVYSALALMVLISGYHVLVERYSRVKVVLFSLLFFSVGMVLFREVFTPHDLLGATLFYVFVDIFSVVLVEQFWSLTDAVSSADQGAKSFWFVGTGGLVGGVVGGLLASFLVTHLGLQTADLLYSCAGLLLVVFVFNIGLWRAGLYTEVHERGAPHTAAGDWRSLLHNRYLMLIAVLLCLSQLAQPIVEFQFLQVAAEKFKDTDQLTAYISEFFSLMGVVSILINVLVTPVIHRAFGAMGGLVVQPVVLAMGAIAFYFHSTLTMAAIMKISDRGLSYSINRASKELLYIPVDPILTYQAKAWIDMFGYRLFKALGSGLILLANAWLGPGNAADLSWLTALICALWILTLVQLAQAYRTVLASA